MIQEVAVVEAEEKRKTLLHDRMRQGGRVAASLGVFVIALLGVGYGTRVVGPMVGGAISGLESLRVTQPEPEPVLTEPLNTQGQNSISVPESTPSVQPVAPGPDPELLNRLDGFSQRTTEAVDAYNALAAEFNPATGFCVDVRAAYGDVQDAWFEYSATGTAQLTAPLDPDRAARDQTLYSAVQNTELSFADTGCPRP